MVHRFQKHLFKTLKIKTFLPALRIFHQLNVVLLV